MTELESSYDVCTKICAEAGSNFASMFAFLPQPQRRAMEVIYAFMRTADNIVDVSPREGMLYEEHVRICAERLERFRAFYLKVVPKTAVEQETRIFREPSRRMKSLKLGDFWNLHATQTGAKNTVSLCRHEFLEQPLNLSELNSVHCEMGFETQIFPALAQVQADFSIPSTYFLETICGMQMDLKHSWYENVVDLETYCYHVASTVGLICLHVWGVSASEILPDAESETLRAAIACGKALQWTNILRDIVEDAQNGRLYLPLEDWLNVYFVNSDLAQGECVYAEALKTILQKDTEKLLPILKINLARAEKFYQEAQTLYSRIPRENRRIFFLITEVYHRIFLKIKRKPQIILEKRVKLGRLEKIWLYMRSFFC